MRRGRGTGRQVVHLRSSAAGPDATNARVVRHSSETPSQSRIIRERGFHPMVLCDATHNAVNSTVSAPPIYLVATPAELARLPRVGPEMRDSERSRRDRHQM